MQITKKTDKKGKVVFGEKFANCDYSVEVLTRDSFKVTFNKGKDVKQGKADIFRLYSYYQDQIRKSDQRILKEKYEYFLKKIKVENEQMVEDLTTIGKKHLPKEKFEFVREKEYPILFISPDKRIAFANKMAIDFLGREIYWIDNFRELKHPKDDTRISIDEYKTAYEELLLRKKIIPPPKRDVQSRRILESKVLDEKRIDNPSIGLKFNFALPYSSLIRINALDVWSCSMANYDSDDGNYLGSMVFFNFRPAKATH